MAASKDTDLRRQGHVTEEQQIGGTPVHAGNAQTSEHPVRPRNGEAEPEVQDIGTLSNGIRVQTGRTPLQEPKERRERRNGQKIMWQAI
jgi:hypothetical protein